MRKTYLIIRPFFLIMFLCLLFGTFLSVNVGAYSPETMEDITLPNTPELSIGENSEEDYVKTVEDKHIGTTYLGEKLPYCDSKWLLDEGSDKVFDNSIEEDLYNYLPEGEIIDIHSSDSVLDVYGRYLESGTKTPCTIRVCIENDVYALDTGYYYGDCITGYNASPNDNFTDAFYGELKTKKSGNIPVRIYAINSLGEKFPVYDEEIYFDEPQYEKELCGEIETLTVENATCHIKGYAYNPEEPWETTVIAVRVSLEDMTDEKIIYLGEASQYSYTLANNENYLNLTEAYSNKPMRFNHEFDITFDVEDERGYRVVSVYALYDFDLDSYSQDYYENNRTVLGYKNCFFSNTTFEIEEVSTSGDGLPYVHGWAFDNERLDGGFRIKFVIENEEYSALNCEYRDDIKNKYGLATNQCGFSYKAYTCACEPGIHTLRIYITVSGGLSNYEYYLLAWEGEVSIPEKREHLDAKANQIGSITVKDNKNDTFTVSGWVQDPDNKSSQLYVGVNIGLLSQNGCTRDRFYTTATDTKYDEKSGTVHYFSKTYSTGLKGNTLFEVYVYDCQYEALGDYPSWYTPCPPNLTTVYSENIYISTPAAYVWKTSAGESTKKAYDNLEDAWKAVITASVSTYEENLKTSEEYTIKLYCDMIGNSENDIIHFDMRNDYDYSIDEDGDSADLHQGSGFIYLTQCSICLDLNGHTIDRRYEYEDVSIVGCCIYVDKFANLTVKNGTIKGGHQSSRSGGGIHVNEGNLNMDNVTMCDNYTYNCGGAIYSEVDSDWSSKFGYVTLTNCTFRNNYADDEGGAIYMDSGTLYMANGSIVSNCADDCGGGLYMNSGFATLTGESVLYNYVNNDEGGGIYIEEGANVRVNDCNIRNNVASLTDNDEGGGIYVEDDGNLELSGTNIIIDNYYYKDCNAFTCFFDGDAGDKFQNNICLESDHATVRSCGINNNSKIGIVFEDEGDSGTMVVNVTERESSVFRADIGSCKFVKTGTTSEVYYEASAFVEMDTVIIIACIVSACLVAAGTVYFRKRKKGENEAK